LPQGERLFYLTNLQASKTLKVLLINFANQIKPLSLQSFWKRAVGKSQYIVQFGGLSVGLHEFEFDVNEKFFKSIENSEIEKASVQINATLTKQNNLLSMHFSISGTVALECDRCLKSVDIPIETEEDLVIKHGNPAESNDEILVIPEGETQFELSQYLYEYITLAIPARRVPCEFTGDKSVCDQEMLDQLDNIASGPEEEKEPNNNPMWEQLNKIKKFNQN
jgi:uncharacterized protein